MILRIILVLADSIFFVSNLSPNSTVNAPEYPLPNLYEYRDSSYILSLILASYPLGLVNPLFIMGIP
jgi:hypothetical protein